MNIHSFRRTKIIATLGPSSNTESIISELILEGVNVFRLNFSHGDHDSHKKNIQLIRKISQQLNVSVGILLDLQGPKIRIGKVIDEGILLREDDVLEISKIDQIGSNFKVSTTFKELINDAQINDRILIDDGLIEVFVIDKNSESLICKVKYGGLLTSNKGINCPNVKLSTMAVTQKDKDDIEFAIANDIDFIALSFVRSVKDILELKNMLNLKEIPIIAKIEKPEALKDLENIIDESYAVMVARGDLGVELSPEDVPVAQKDIISIANKKGKAVIIATQMLDSMIRNPRPTRAEASDVANAILDGADAIMLSGETASGKYPVASVKMMNKIAVTIESRFISKWKSNRRAENFDFTNISEAVSYSAVNIARNLDAKLIVCLTHSGNTAMQLSKFRSFLPILAISDDDKVPRKMSLTWGVTCLLIDKIENTEECFDKIETLIESSEFLENNDLIILTAGMPTLAKNSTNMIKVHKVIMGKTKII